MVFSFLPVFGFLKKLFQYAALRAKASASVPKGRPMKIKTRPGTPAGSLPTPSKKAEGHGITCIRVR
jgi:hypothetical protein